MCLGNRLTGFFQARFEILFRALLRVKADGIVGGMLASTL